MIIIIALLFVQSLVLSGEVKAQTATPTPEISSNVNVSVTIVVPQPQTPTPTPGPTTTPSPLPGETTPTETPTTTPTIQPPYTPPTTAKKVGMKIYGYAPSDVFVSLMGRNVLELTKSNLSGYFEFNNVPIPQATEILKFYPELCLQAYYKEVSTQPVCLPKIPTGQEEYSIGPVVLSPILIIEKGSSAVNSQVKAVGKTTPNTEVFVFLAKEEQKTTIFDFIEKIKLIQNVSAYYLPRYQTISDDNGNFEFNLPTESSSRWRVFAASNFQGQNSPKSNTLSFLVVPQTFGLIQKILSLLASLFSQWFFNLVLLEIIITLILLRSIAKTKKINN
jgi:hypothetical protein